MSGKKNRNITPYLIHGEEEFYQAFGIKGNDKQSQLRAEGMPCYYDGKSYFYDPDEVKTWLKRHFAVPMLTLQN
jgi:hypothetical protein